MAGKDDHRAKSALLNALAAVPLGKVTTPADLAAAAGVAEHEVAGIIARLDGRERDIAPWHRVVTGGGGLPALSDPVQRRLLSFEGVSVTDGTVDGFEQRRHAFPGAE